MNHYKTPQLSRRTALKVLAGSALTLYLRPAELFAAPLQQEAHEADSWLEAVSPIDRTLSSEAATRQFFGDQFERPHSILWDKQRFMADAAQGPQEPIEKAPIVIVGGGISGLFTAWLLRHHNPIVLEQAPRFGGNSKGQAWNGVDYAIGAAYLLEPEPDSELFELVQQLGIDKLWRVKEGSDLFELHSLLKEDFWSGKEAGEDTRQFKLFSDYLRALNVGNEVPFPEIPITDPTQANYIKALDQVSFLQHMRDKAGGEIHPILETAIEHYCWSSFGGSASEIGAASGLNFYAAEFGKVAVLPGGNAALAERTLVRLTESIPVSSLRAGCLVYDVSVGEKEAVVSYQAADGKVRKISASAVVMACPKFVVNKVLAGIEERRVAAIKRLKYRSYLVANVLLRGQHAKSFYDLYLLGDGKVDVNAVRISADQQGCTDIVLANYAQPNTSCTVLTLYRPFPYDNARLDLYAPNSYSLLRKGFEEQISSSILPLLGMRSEDVVDLRIARWGHPLPLAEKGLIADGTVDQLRKPFKERVFFVEQDNWALPAFETAASEAITWSKEINKFLASKSA